MQLPATMSVPLQLRAQTQGGTWTRQDAVELGHTDDELALWVRRGAARQACRGAYYAPLPARGGPEDDRDELRRRAQAMLLVLPANVVLSHHTAVTAHGIARLEPVRHDEVVHLMPTTGRRSNARPEVRVHRPAPGTPIGTRGGLRLVAPADAVAQYAASCGLEAGVVAADDALHRTVITADALIEACARLRGRRGARTLSTLIDHVDGRSESVGESRTRLLCVAAGIPVEPQVEIHDGSGSFVARVDLLVDGTRVLIEFDGLAKYRGDENAAALVHEKRREHALHRLGYVVVRVTWDDLRSPDEVVRRIREAVERCAAA